MNDHNNLDLALIMASIVHDVKNSLGLIQHQVESMVPQLHDKNPEIAVQLQQLSLEAGRINHGLIHMLGLYRLKEGMLSPCDDECFLMDVLDDVRTKFISSLEVLKIEFTVDQHDPDMIWNFDQTMVDGILSNVITNAIRYTKSKLMLSTYEENGYLVIQIKDDGDGYPENMIQYVQPQTQMNYQTGSTGLGLYFSSQIAQMHQVGDKRGYIELSNDKQTGGAIFRLFLP
ncbi:MAG: HAMP domain-containing histidine kinase [Saccharospirillaceae bacterium]|nr:HAMP domain-containing histidine kinase [Pseudomonadales bacterium]NRB78265.1 HAMP domain-containing histidine kinase [Saccharospirillaceae bacterium]